MIDWSNHPEADGSTYQAPVSMKTPGREIGGVGLIKLEDEAKKSSVWWRMRAPSGAEIRSVVEANVASIWSIGMESSLSGTTS